jgi:hypothetical protein
MDKRDIALVAFGVVVVALAVFIVMAYQAIDGIAGQTSDHSSLLSNL